jgi:hypothetical protein
MTAKPPPHVQGQTVVTKLEKLHTKISDKLAVMQVNILNKAPPKLQDVNDLRLDLLKDTAELNGWAKTVRDELCFQFKAAQKKAQRAASNQSKYPLPKPCTAPHALSSLLPSSQPFPSASSTPKKRKTNVDYFDSDLDDMTLSQASLDISLTEPSTPTPKPNHEETTDSQQSQTADSQQSLHLSFQAADAPNKENQNAADDSNNNNITEDEALNIINSD